MGTYYAQDRAGNVIRIGIAGDVPDPKESKRIENIVAHRNSLLPPAPEPVQSGIGQSAFNFGKGALYGLGTTGTGLLRTAGGIGDYLAGYEEPGALSRFGKSAEEGLAQAAGPSPGYEDSLSYGAGNLTGMLGGFLIPGTAAAKLVKAGTTAEEALAAANTVARARLLGETTVGAGIGGGEAISRMDEYEQQKNVKLDPDTKIVSTLLGSAIGTTFSFPIERIAKPLAQLLRFVPKDKASTVAQSIAERLKDAAVTGGVAGVQNVIYGVGQDLVEKGAYNPDIDPTDSIMSDLTIGGGVGALLHFAIGRAYNKRLTGNKQLYDDINAENAAAAEAQAQKKAEAVSFTNAVGEGINMGGVPAAESARGEIYRNTLGDISSGIQRTQELSKPGLNEPRRPYMQPSGDGLYQAFDEFDRPLGQKAKSVDAATRQIDNYLKAKQDAAEIKRVDANEPLTFKERMATLEKMRKDTFAEAESFAKDLADARTTRRKVELGPAFDARISRIEDSIARLKEERANQTIDPVEFGKLDIDFGNTIGEKFTASDVINRIAKDRLRSRAPDMNAPLTRAELGDAYKAMRPTSRDPNLFVDSVFNQAEAKRKADYLESKKVAEPKPAPEPAPEAVAQPEPMKVEPKVETPKNAVEAISGVPTPPEGPRPEINVGDRVKFPSGHEAVVEAKNPAGHLRVKNAISYIPPERVTKVEPPPPPPPEAPKAEAPKAEAPEGPKVSPADWLTPVDTKIIEQLQQRLHGYGLKSVALEIKRWLEGAHQAGSLTREGPIPKIIELATGIYKKGMTDAELLAALAKNLDHETFHAVFKVLEPGEVSALENYVLKTNMPNKMYTYVQYHQARSPEGTTRAHILEEAMADAFRDWASGDLKISGKPRTVLAHIFSIFKRIGEWWSGAQNAREVFEKIQRGEVAKRIPEAAKPAPDGRTKIEDVIGSIKSEVESASLKPETKFTTLGDPGDMKRKYREAAYGEDTPEKFKVRQALLRDALWHDMKLVRDAGSEYKVAYQRMLDVEQQMMNAAYHSEDGTVPNQLWDELRASYEAATVAKDRAMFDTIDMHAEARDVTDEYSLLRRNFQSMLDNIIGKSRTPSNILNDTMEALHGLRQTFINKPPPTTPPESPKPGKPNLTVIRGGKDKTPETKFSTIGGKGDLKNPSDLLSAAEKDLKFLKTNYPSLSALALGADDHHVEPIHFVHYENAHRRLSDAVDDLIVRGDLGGQSEKRLQSLRSELADLEDSTGHEEIVSIARQAVTRSFSGKPPEKKHSTIGMDGTYDKPGNTPEEQRLTLGNRVARALDPATRIRNLEYTAFYNGVHNYLAHPGVLGYAKLKTRLLGGTVDMAAVNKKAEELATWAVRVFADRMISLAKMVDHIKRNGGTVDESFDPYLMNEVLMGQTQHLVNINERKLYGPMKEAMFRMGFNEAKVKELSARNERAATYLGHTKDANNAMLGLYLYARHAPERNAVMKLMNPNGKPALDADGRVIEGKQWSSEELSGMSNKDSAEILDFFARQPNAAKLYEAANLIDKIIEDTNNIRREAGLLPLEFHYKTDEGFGKLFSEAGVYADDAKTQLGYKNYVPLRGYAEDVEYEDSTPAHAKGFQTLRREDPRALGRGSMAAKIVENVLLQNEQAILRAQRAKVGQAFLKMIRENPKLAEGFAKIVEHVPLKWTLVDGAYRIKGTNPEGVKIPLEKDSRTGLHTRLQFDPIYKSRPDNPYFTVKEKVDGGGVNEVVIDILDPSLRRAMKGEIGLKSETALAVFNHIGKYTRFLANLATSWNPEFLFMNAQRDIIAAGINLQQFELEGVGRGMAKNVLPMMKMLWTMSPKARLDYVKSGKGDYFIREDVEKLPAEMRDRANRVLDFQEDGGSVEFLGMKELGDIVTHINDQLRDPATFSTLEKSKAGFKRFGEFIEAYNKIVENGTRLSVYSSLRDALEKKFAESGMTREHAVRSARDQAARAAKNMTANFNRGGELKSIINALYMFYNASLQGTFGIVTAARNSKKVQGILMGIMAYGAAQDAMMSMLSPDDENGRKTYDNLSEWVLRNRLVFIDPFGVTPKGYFAIPMPYGFSAIFNFGRSTMRAARGTYTPGEAASSAFGALADGFNPLSGSNSFLNFVAPTLLDPIVDLSLNRDFKNDPIAKTPSAYGVQAPQSQLHWNNTTTPSIKIAEWVNYLTGGDTGISGAVDISPDQLDYIAGFLTGGAGKFLGRAETGFEKVLTGNVDDLTPSDVPVLRAFVGGVSDRNLTEEYINARQEVLQPAKAIKDAAAAGDVKTANALRQSYGDKLRLMGVFQAVDSARNKLANRLRQIQNNVNIPEETKAALKKQIKKQIVDQENRALRAYNGESP